MGWRVWRKGFGNRLVVSSLFLLADMMLVPCLAQVQTLFCYQAIASPAKTCIFTRERLLASQMARDVLGGGVGGKT